MEIRSCTLSYSGLMPQVETFLPNYNLGKPGTGVYFHSKSHNAICNSEQIRLERKLKIPRCEEKICILMSILCVCASIGAHPMLSELPN